MFVEFVKYRVKAASEEERPDESWVDVWTYETEEVAKAANAGAGDIPAFVTFVGVLDGVEIESGVMPDAALVDL